MGKRKIINTLWVEFNKRRVTWAIRFEDGNRYQMALCTQCVKKLNQKAIKQYPTNMSIYKKWQIGGRVFPKLRYMSDYRSWEKQPEKCENCGWREKK